MQRLLVSAMAQAQKTPDPTIHTTHLICESELKDGSDDTFRVLLSDENLLRSSRRRYTTVVIR